MSNAHDTIKALEKLTDAELSATISETRRELKAASTVREQKTLRELLLAALYVAEERDPSAPIYRVIRFYQRDLPSRTIATGLTLAEAKAHCNDPETSSETATSAKANAVTRRNGPWFDGYDRADSFAEFKRRY
jgi:hypothetical protein